MKADAEAGKKIGLAVRTRDDEARARLIEEALPGIPVPFLLDLVERIQAPERMDYEGAEILLRQSAPKISVRLRSASKEPFTVKWIEGFEPGDVFYDGGANVGAYSLIAAKSSGGAVRTFAFEPSAPSYHDLCLNVVLNDCAASVTPVPLALWSETALIPFAHFSLEPGTSNHRFDFETGYRDLDREWNQQQPAVSIDDAVALFGLPVPTHVKLDTEGSELRILAGAATTLSNPAWRTILMEFDSDEKETGPAEVEELIGPHGFELRDSYAPQKEGAVFHHLYARDAR